MGARIQALAGFLVLLLTASVSAASPVDRQVEPTATNAPVKVRQTIRQELQRVATERIPTEAETEAVMAKYGYHKLDSIAPVTLDSSGNNLSILNVSVWVGSGGYATATMTWDWNNNTWDYFNGPSDVVAINFTDSNGQGVPGMLLSSYQARLYAYWKNGSRCANDGWVHDLDNVNKGIIFRYQDYTSTFGTDMCGDQGWGMIDIDTFPATPRPVIAKLTYHHNWNTATFKSISFGASVGDKSTINLNVTYESSASSWQRAMQLPVY